MTKTLDKATAAALREQVKTDEAAKQRAKERARRAALKAALVKHKLVMRELDWMLSGEVRDLMAGRTPRKRPDLAWCGYAALPGLVEAARKRFLRLPAGDESRRLGGALIAAVHGLMGARK